MFKNLKEQSLVVNVQNSNVYLKNYYTQANRLMQFFLVIVLCKYVYYVAKNPKRKHSSVTTD